MPSRPAEALADGGIDAAAGPLAKGQGRIGCGGQPMALEVEPREEGAVAEIKQQRAALEPEDAGGHPAHQPAGVHRAEGQRW